MISKVWTKFWSKVTTCRKSPQLESSLWNRYVNYTYLPQVILEIANLELIRINTKNWAFWYWRNSGRGVTHPLCKIRSRQPMALKFDRLTADVMNYKIYSFRNPVIRNYTIMMLLPQKITKSGPQQNQGFYKSYLKMYFLLNLSHCVKSYRHLFQISTCS